MPSILTSAHVGSAQNLSHIKIGGKYLDVINDSEKLDLELRGYYARDLNDSWRSIDDEIFRKMTNFVIHRNFLDDTFSMNALSVGSGNNKLFNALSTSNKATAWEGREALAFDGKVVARPFSIDNEEFLKSSSWTSSYFAHMNDSSPALFQQSIFPHFAKLSGNYVLGENQVLRLNLIKDFSSHSDIKPNRTFSNTEAKHNLESSNFSSMTNYVALYVVPRKVDQYKHQVSIADIYIDKQSSQNDFEPLNQDNHFHHFKFDDEIKYRSTSLTNDIKGIYSDEFNENAQKVTNYVGDWGYENQLQKIATLNLSDFTSYNYESSKTEILRGEDSQRGEQIPFNFKGNFSRTFSLGLCSVLKNINITAQTNIQKAVLDPMDGHVKMNLNKVQQEATSWNILNTEQMKNFRAYLDTEKYVALQGIKGFSDE